MDLELFAQVARNNANNAAFQAGFKIGFVIGIILVVLICGGIPIAVGLSRRRPVLGIIGGVASVCAGLLFFGCLTGLPTALVFVAIILALGEPGQKKRRRKTYDDYDYDFRDDDDDYDRPRKKRRRDDYYDDEDDYDRPRSRDIR